MDRRVRYTKTVLNTSLLKFLKKKDISKITVKELCLDADVNRSTYYSHFTDPFDQLNQLKTGLMEDVVEYTRNLSIHNSSTVLQQECALKSILQYIESKRNIFQILLTRNSNLELQNELLQILGEKIFRTEQLQVKALDEAPYLMIYITNGCYAMFLDWLMSKDPVSSDRLAYLMASFSKKFYI